jgi:DNA-directed RNA polymerase specialized sigma24 family protein
MTRRDPEAFSDFVAARSGALHRTAYLLVGDRGLAQDLLQEALTKTYVAWPRLRDPRSPEAYTRKAITTTAISWYRRKAWTAERPGDRPPDRGRPGHDAEVTRRHVGQLGRGHLRRSGDEGHALQLVTFVRAACSRPASRECERP